MYFEFYNKKKNKKNIKLIKILPLGNELFLFSFKIEKHCCKLKSF